jgi:hypothetical protein
MAQRDSEPTKSQLFFLGFQNFCETRGIFSEHYIRTKLKDSSLWPQEEAVKPLWEFCKNLWAKRHITLARSDEEFTKQEFLEPILTKLGFTYLRGRKLPLGRKEPDYLLFIDETTKEKVLDKDKSAQYAAAISVLEAKKVNHPLDAASQRETPGRFPHQQIRDYLQEVTDQSGNPYFRWAILTNGNKWRLYCRDAHPTHYFELNFEVAVQSLKNFMIFAVLFSPTAFAQYTEGRCPLDDLRDEALQHQTALEDDLRKRIFVILTRLANGFYKQAENKVSKDKLDELYENCLIFLYRLLFVLYAEGLNLLPVKPGGAGSNKNYRERYSLQRLLPQLKNPLKFTSDEFVDLYEDMLKLFHLINGNQPSLNKKCDVPLYNGRLFDSKKYPLLEKWRLGEKTLAEVLRGLMFSKIPVGKGEQEKFDFGETIDYADLEVRQLGSIYEGLLENHLELEDSGLVLKEDRAERKATGTYYTPDYIVRYIVENTLGPLCDEIDKSKEVKTAINKGLKDNSFAKAVLKLKVLDPAMGSGHFLVRATESLADKIFNHPTTALQVEKVLRGLSPEDAEIAYWRRRVVESSIYGVDLNPLAVELAKLSLWLTCIATDQPLSFLDHHLRPGNSLIGTKLKDLDALPKKKKTKQIFLFAPGLRKAVSDAMKALNEIIEMESKDLSIIKEKETRWHKEVRTRLEPYRTVADLWTSTLFGTKIDEIEYQNLAKLMVLNPKPRTKESVRLKKKIEPYLGFYEVTKNKMFFHWELEFPEVFFNEDGTPKENPGFDTVIGNPPYGAEMGREEKNFIDAQFKTNTHDSAAYFLEASQRLSHKFYGMIVPKSIAFYTQWESIRKLLLEKDFVSNLLDVGIAFKDVNYEQLVLIFSKLGAENFKTSICRATPLKRSKKEKRVTPDGDVSIDLMKIANVLIFRGISNSEKQIIQKIKEVSIPFDRIFKEVYRGLYISDADKKQLSLGKYKFVNKVPDVRRYCIEKILKIDIRHKGEWIEKARKIMVPRLFLKVLRGERLIAFYDKMGEFLTTEKLVNITLKPTCDYSYAFLTALINSPLISFYLQRILFSRVTETSRVMDEPYVRDFPIRCVAFTTPEKKRQRLAKELQMKIELEKFNELLKIVETYLPKDKTGHFITEKEKSDVVHDLLAHLAEQMIRMNKEKQKHTNEFLTWLENEFIKGSIENLKNKTKIKKFYDYPLESIIEVLTLNKLLPKFIRPDDDRYKTLSTVLEKTMAKLGPLRKKITTTDNLIDQIVYKLYGLTEEEIKIIERSFSGSN